MPANLKKYLQLSFFGHTILFLALYVSHKMEWRTSPLEEATPPSLKVSLKGLPDLPSRRKAKKPNKTPTPLPKPKRKSDKEPIPLNKEEPSLDKTKAEKPRKEKAPSDKTKAENFREEKADETPTEEGPVKGNRLSEGLSEGEQNALKIAVNEYLIEIMDQTKRNWNLPKYLTDQDLQAKVEIKIDARGRVLEKKIIERSQNELFDGRVLKAIEQSAPFPPPPESVRDLLSDGIVFQLKSGQ